MNRSQRSRKAQMNSRRHLFLDHYPARSRFAEAYLTLRTNVSFSCTDKDFHVLLVTSASEREGKTISAFNLAHTLVRSGRSVLMIDSDLRKPFLSRLISSNDSSGLTGLLSNLFGTTVRSGALTEYRLGDLLRLLSMQKKTGRLRLSEKRQTVEFFFLHGEVKDLNWVTRPPRKKLATVLQKQGLLSQDQVDQALSQQKTTKQKLGFILLNGGFLKKDELAGHLTIQVMEGLRRALQFREGEFSFEDLSESAFDPAAFDPVDFNRVYKQTMVGEEELLFLKKGIDSALVATGTDGLFLLPAGKLPPNPADILSSGRMSFLISHLKKSFDTLILDSPPVLPASDATVVAPHVDGVLLVIKAGKVKREMVKKAVEQLDLAQANILGVVLNQVDTKREGYYKYYHKYYSKYYGQKE